MREDDDLSGLLRSVLCGDAHLRLQVDLYNHERVGALERRIAQLEADCESHKRRADQAERQLWSEFLINDQLFQWVRDHGLEPPEKLGRRPRM